MFVRVALFALCVLPTISDSAESLPPLPSFVPTTDIKTPTIDVAPRTIETPELSSKNNSLSLNEHADITAFRTAQQTVNTELKRRKIKPPQGFDYSKQPQFAHHCVKLVFSQTGQPRLTNTCQSPINIAYCWLGISAINGANECHLNQYALSHGGEIDGPLENKANFGLFVFACTQSGTPYQLRFDDQKKRIMGQCFW